MDMNISNISNIKEYKKVSSRIGWSLCIFLAMINIVSLLRTVIADILFENLIYDAYYIVDSLLYDIGYLASFIVPAIIIRHSLKKKGLLQPLKQNTGKLTATSLLLIPIGIFVTQLVGYINSIAMSIFGVSEAYSELVGGYEFYFGYEIVLMFIGTALVPAVAEEFLFRATVLSNLKPYGKIMAVVGSSVLFGLMHQNPYQLLYATASGLVLGYAYLKTGSIWCPMLIHFFNNAFSVTQQVILGNCQEDVAIILVLLTNLLMYIVGVICAIFYIKKMIKEKRVKYKNGSFGVLLEESYDYSSKPIEKGKVRGFFTVGMIVFIVLALLLSFLLLAVLMDMSGGAA